MSKELDALKIVRTGGIGYTYDEYSKAVDIVENALEELDFCKKRDKQWKQDVNKNIDRLKSLEIIKEKRVNVNQFLKHCSSNNKWGYNKTVCDKKRQLTQEEYDLLKEVLL